MDSLSLIPKKSRALATVFSVSSWSLSFKRPINGVSYFEKLAESRIGGELALLKASITGEKSTVAEGKGEGSQEGEKREGPNASIIELPGKVKDPALARVETVEIPEGAA